MKKYWILALAALAAFVSCQKEDLQIEPSIKESPVFTATINDGSTKATIAVDESVAKIKWEATDSITITDASNRKAVYKVSSGAGTKSATFTIKEGEKALGEGPYTATFGKAPSPGVAQRYSAAASIPIYMTAPSTTTTDLSFSAQCGVLNLKLTDATHGVMRIVVSNETNDYTLNIADEVDITSEKDFYLVLPEDTYTTVKVFDNTGMVAKKTGLAIVVTLGHLKPASTSTLSFEVGTTGITGGHAWVQLWSDGTKWAETNVGAIEPDGFGDYFAWGATETYYSSKNPLSWKTGFDNGYCWANAPFNGGNSDFNESAWNASKSAAVDASNNLLPEKDAAHVQWGGSWRMPTDAEWALLRNNCTWTYTTTQNGVKGHLITSSIGNSIFLPFSGYFTGTNLRDHNFSGNYWSSTNNTFPTSTAFYMFTAQALVGLFNYYHYYGIAVRPVLG